jgi:hypothetical protein
MHVGKFNDRIRAMNSGNSKELRLTAQEARSLHADIFAMLDELAKLRESGGDDEVIEISLDAGDNSL